MHNVTPDGVFVSSQGTKLVVVDLFDVTYPGSRVLGMRKGSMPYSNQDLVEHELTGYHNQERTMWSIGIMILELFVGSEVVECLRTHQDVFDLTTHIAGQVGNRLYALLHGLLFEVRFKVVMDTLEDGILDDATRVSMALKEVTKKVKESNIVEKMLKEK